MRYSSASSIGVFHLTFFPGRNMIFLIKPCLNVQWFNAKSIKKSWTLSRLISFCSWGNTIFGGNVHIGPYKIICPYETINHITHAWRRLKTGNSFFFFELPIISIHFLWFWELVRTRETPFLLAISAGSENSTLVAICCSLTRRSLAQFPTQFFFEKTIRQPLNETLFRCWLC